MSVTSLGKRQALGNDRMDIAATEHLDQHVEVLAEPLGIAWRSADRSGVLLSDGAEPLDLILERSPTG